MKWIRLQPLTGVLLLLHLLGSSERMVHGRRFTSECLLIIVIIEMYWRTEWIERDKGLHRGLAGLWGCRCERPRLLSAATTRDQLQKAASQSTVWGRTRHHDVEWPCFHVYWSPFYHIPRETVALTAGLLGRCTRLVETSAITKSSSTSSSLLLVLMCVCVCVVQWLSSQQKHNKHSSWRTSLLLSTPHVVTWSTMSDTCHVCRSISSPNQLHQCFVIYYCLFIMFVINEV